MTGDNDMRQLKIYTPSEWQRAFPTPTFSHRFLAQGDSWFSIGALPPMLTTNLLMEMNFADSACAVNYAQPGAEAAQMVSPSATWVFNPTFVFSMQQTEWDGILMSLGGNDLIDAIQAQWQDASTHTLLDRSLRLLLTPSEWGPQADVSRFLSVEGWQTFRLHLHDVFGNLVALRDRNGSKSAGKPLFFHSYHYTQPRNVGVGLHGLYGGWQIGPWLYKALVGYGIPNSNDEWRLLSRQLMDQLCMLFKDIVATHPQLYFADLRNAPLAYANVNDPGATTDWANEIHPTHVGYRTLADAYAGFVEATLQPRATPDNAAVNAAMPRIAVPWASGGGQHH
jgi:hypothetical protein